MAMISVIIWDTTGGKKNDVDLPDNAPVQRILPVLVDKMQMPTKGPDGQPQVYYLLHKRSGKQLQENQCLTDVGAQSGDVLRIQPRITAGR